MSAVLEGPEINRALVGMPSDHFSTAINSAIEVDLTRAINDPRSRPLVQAGDTLILQYKCEEELLNFGIATFFTFGIRELLRGNSN